MASLTYTKRCIVEFLSPEGLTAHDNNVEYQYWYYEQIDNNLGEPTHSWLPFKYISPTMGEVLCVNQSQAEELVAISNRISEELNHPITSITILDFSDTIESFGPDPRSSQQDV